MQIQDHAVARGTPTIRLEPEDEAFVRKCVELRLPAILMWPDQGRVRRGQFLEMDAETVALTLEEEFYEVDPQGPSPRSRCCVTFHTQGRTCAFIAFERTFHPGGPDCLPTVILTLPAELASETRNAFRVPVLPESGLILRVRKAGRPVRMARPVDVSLAGVLVAFPAWEDPQFLVDEEVTLFLERDAVVLQLAAAVRRRSEEGDEVYYGFYFDPVANGSTSERALNAMVRGVERFWIQNRSL